VFLGGFTRENTDLLVSAEAEKCTQVNGHSKKNKGGGTGRSGLFRRHEGRGSKGHFEGHCTAEKLKVLADGKTGGSGGNTSFTAKCLGAPEKPGVEKENLVEAGIGQRSATGLGRERGGRGSYFVGEN